MSLILKVAEGEGLSIRHAGEEMLLKVERVLPARVKLVLDGPQLFKLDRLSSQEAARLAAAFELAGIELDRHPNLQQIVSRVLAESRRSGRQSG